MSTTEAKTGLSIPERDQKEVLAIYSMIRAAEAKLVGPDGKTQCSQQICLRFFTRSSET